MLSGAWGLLFMLLIPLILSWGVYYWKFTGAPTVPNVNLDEWWAEYPIDMKRDNSTRPYTIEFPEMVNC